MTDYAVGLPHHPGRDGGVIWYGGRKLAADLTLPKLRGRWELHSRSAERPVGYLPGVEAGTGRLTADGLTVGERELIYGHAARQTAHAAEHIRYCVRRDPGRAADAAWAAADALHTAARITNNRALRRAADAYDRAARAPFGRLPPCTRAGSRLRAAARTLALMEQPDGDACLAALALIGSLVTLTLAVGSCARPSSKPCGLRPPAQRPGTCVPRRRSSGPGHPAPSGRTCGGGPGDGGRRIWPAMRPPRRRCLDAPGLPSQPPAPPDLQRQGRASLSGRLPGRARAADDGHGPRQQCRRGPRRHARDRRMPEISHGQTILSRATNSSNRALTWEDWWAILGLNQ